MKLQGTTFKAKGNGVVVRRPAGKHKGWDLLLGLPRQVTGPPDNTGAFGPKKKTSRRATTGILWLFIKCLFREFSLRNT